MRVGLGTQEEESPAEIILTFVCMYQNMKFTCGAPPIG